MGAYVTVEDITEAPVKTKRTGASLEEKLALSGLGLGGIVLTATGTAAYIDSSSVVDVSFPYYTALKIGFGLFFGGFAAASVYGAGRKMKSWYNGKK